MKKVRLDQLVFDQGLSESRERAKAIIMSGVVYVNGQRADKPGAQVAPDAKIEVRGNTLPYVSRGGFKLEKALRVFPIDPTGLTCIDCGASTGGFTDVLLQNGAAKVYAVDVGYGQLAWSLRNDPRVISMERTNVRYITAEQIPEPLDLAVMDLSFISVKLILPAVCPLLKDDAAVVCLIKPQFEAGREEVGKKASSGIRRCIWRYSRAFWTLCPARALPSWGWTIRPSKGRRATLSTRLSAQGNTSRAGARSGGHCGAVARRTGPRKRERRMKHIVIAANPYRDSGLQKALTVYRMLTEHGHRVVMSPVFAPKAYLPGMSRCGRWRPPRTMLRSSSSWAAMGRSCMLQSRCVTIRSRSSA